LIGALGGVDTPDEHTHTEQNTLQMRTHTHTLTRTHSERLRGMKRTDSV